MIRNEIQGLNEAIELKLRILIADDLPQVRQGLATVLTLATKNLQPKIEVIGEARNGSEAIIHAQSLQPDVILMDLEMPVLDGISATQMIKAQHPSIRIIILTIHDDSESRERALRAGAEAYLEKSEPLERLVHVIQGCHKNQAAIEKELA